MQTLLSYASLFREFLPHSIVDRYSRLMFPVLRFRIFRRYVCFYSVRYANTISQKALACTDDRFVDRSLRTIEGLCLAFLFYFSPFTCRLRCTLRVFFLTFYVLILLESLFSFFSVYLSDNLSSAKPLLREIYIVYTYIRIYIYICHIRRIG